MPGQANIATRIARDIDLNLPIISSAMDTVTEARLAIAMAQAGGIGMIHRNLNPGSAGRAGPPGQEVRVRHGRQSGDHRPDATLSDALALMKAHGISGIPVVEHARPRQPGPGRLVGILTNRDVRFASDPDQKVHELMTREPRHRARECRAGRGQAAAAPAPHREAAGGRRRGYCVGLITVKDIEKSQLNPNAAKDEQGRLRAAAATSVGEDGFERAEMLIDAGWT
jgi:IMP dehydrogenase